MSREERIDVTPLADTYDIVAELGAEDSTRSFIGKRRADGMDVVITVAGTPAGDERNALTHLAADVKLLSTLEHRHLVPVFEGRWLGGGALAIVKQRVFAPTVEELLSRGERFSNARVAAILREVNGILDWARRERVVHRAVTTDTVYLEPGTDRVLVAFELRPIPLIGAPEAEGDARTVATLARAMLARSAEEAAHEERPEEHLADLRRDLPARVIERTKALLHPTRGGAAPDIPGYLALIAMADAVKVGEDESARVTQQTLEEQRVTRAQLEADRERQERELAEQRQQLAEDRERLEGEIAGQREALAAERAELERSVADERARLARDRAELTAAIAAAHEQLSLERQQLERQRLAAFEASAEREAAPARSKGERVVPPVFVPAADAPPAVELPMAAALQPDSGESVKVTEPDAADADEKRRLDHRAWAIPAGIVTAAGILLAAGLALAGRSSEPRLVPLGTSNVAASDSGVALARATSDSTKLVVDSAAGTVTATTRAASPTASPAAAPGDSTAIDSARSDSVRADSIAAARRAAAARRRKALAQAQAARDSAAADSAKSDPFFLPRAPRTPRADSTPRDTSSRRSGTRPRDSAFSIHSPVARPDSGRRDSVPRLRPDSTPPA